MRSMAAARKGDPVQADESADESLVRELGRISTELAAQRRLNAMTVHDLSNPAQVILGLSEVLLEHQVLDPLVRKHLEQVHRSAVTMTALITDLGKGFALDDDQSLELERLDLVELVSSVVERTRMLADAKDMLLLVFAEQVDHRGCWVDGDSVRLERALVNLLGNAIKFSPAGSHVAIAVDRGANFARVSVHDQGPGISEDGKSRIFEVFHREQDTAHLPGLGLGLFITKQIAESHGGTVSVESELGDGATFELQVPLAVEVLADPA
jgi:signal transduction histidine kinase